MSIDQHLQSLRSKPEHVRKRISFWSSFGITAIIFVFWLGSFSNSGSQMQSAVAKKVQNADTPGKTLVAGVGTLFTDIKELVFGAKKVEYSSIEVLPDR